MDAVVVDQVSLRPEGLATFLARKRSLSRVLPQVDSQIKLLDKTLATLRTKMALLIFDPHMAVQFVRLQLSFGNKATPT